MKTIIKIFSITVFLFYCCSKDSATFQCNQVFNYYASDSTYQYSYYEYYNEIGLIIKSEYVSDENRTSVKEYFYDNDNNLIEYHEKEANVPYYKYFYNADKLKVKSENYDDDWNLMGYTIYEYNSNHQLIKSIPYDRDSNFSIYTDYFYSKGLLDSIITSNTNQKVLSKVEYYYDNNSNLIEKNAFARDEIDSPLTKSRIDLYEYDNKNRKIKHTSISPLQDLFGYSIFYYDDFDYNYKIEMYNIDDILTDFIDIETTCGSLDLIIPE